MNAPSPHPLVTIAVPSLNQGRFLDEALRSIFDQDVPVEVFVADAGSTDNSLEVIQRWKPRLNGWRSHPDGGQADAVNECIARGTAPYVAWMNSDDMYAPGGLRMLLEALEAHPERPAAYGRAWNVDAESKPTSRVWVQDFSEKRLAIRCIISQPATLIRRTAWDAVGGLDETLHMSLDYDLWWRLYRQFGPFLFVGSDIAVNRNHDQTKTRSQRKRQHLESMAIVRKYHGSIPLKWWLSWPVSVWLRSWLTPQRS